MTTFFIITTLFFGTAFAFMVKTYANKPLFDPVKHIDAEKISSYLCERIGSHKLLRDIADDQERPKEHSKQYGIVMAFEHVLEWVEVQQDLAEIAKMKPLSGKNGRKEPYKLFEE